MKKFLIFSGVIVFAMLLAAQVYVRSDGFESQLRPYLLKPLADVLGSDTTIGRIRANFIPLYIEVRDVSLPMGKGKQATIRKFRAYVNPLPLLLRKIRVPLIVILEPKIFVERAKSGELDISSVIDKVRANINRRQEQASSSFAVHLRTISINKGRLWFKDDSSGTQITFSRVQARTKVSVGRDSITISLKNAAVNTTTPAFGELAGNLSALTRYDRNGFQLESMDFVTTDALVSLSGTIGPFPDPALNLSLQARTGPQTIGRFTKLLKHLRKERRSQVEVSAALRGNFSSPLIEGVFKLAGISYRNLLLPDAMFSFGYQNRHLNLTGEKLTLVKGNDEITVDSIKADLNHTESGLDIQQFGIQAGDLEILISGRADPRRGFDALVTAESSGDGRVLSFLTSLPVGGNIGVKGYLTGAFNEPIFDGMVSAGPVTVRGIAFNDASGRLQYREKMISLVSVDIHKQVSRYLFNGSVDLKEKEPMFSARLKVIRSDVRSIVALFYKPLPLHFSATGDLAFNGTARDYTGSGRLALESGTAYGESFTKGTITAALTRGKIAFPDVAVDKGSGRVKGTGWIGFDRTYSATIESHGVRLSEVNLLTGSGMDGIFDFMVESSGSFASPVVAASLQTEEFSFNQTALGGLSSGLQMSDKVLVWKSNLDDGRAGFTFRLGLGKPYEWNAQAAMNERLLDPFHLLGKKDFLDRAKLDLEGRLTIQGTGKDISTLVGTAAFDRFGILVGDYRLENEGTAVLSVKGDRLNINSLKLSGQGTKMTVAGSGRYMKEADFQCSGSANLSLLRPLFGFLEHSGGIAEFKLAITDNWNNPDIEGELLFRDAEIKIRDIPEKFSGLTGKITFDKSRIILDSLTGEVGGGRLHVSGKGQLAGLSLVNYSSSIGFDSVTARYPEGLTSTLSGNLYFDGGFEESSLTGDVVIKRARYEKRVEWKSMLVDIGKRLHQKKKTESGWIGETQINIRFSGKENVLFQNNLAKIPLDVDVFLGGTVNRPQLLGRIEAGKGSVYFRQNEFKLLRSSVDFVDQNRVNPVLDIQAEIQIRSYLVRLAVSGTADRAVVTLLSDPPLPDSDILALLALGKTGTELEGKEAGVGVSEAASFATGQFQDIIESRARSLTGLDRFQVDPYVSKGDTSVPRVTVGKEVVQDKLYVTYSSNVGSAMPEQIFRIEYILNKHFSLMGERNELGNTGADIKYRFEFR